MTYFGQDCYYYPWRDALAVVIAEKGPASTWERSPVQFEYRSAIRLRGPRRHARDCAPNGLGTMRPIPTCAAALRFHRSQRPPLFASTEKVALPPEFLHYSPETAYCGSLLPNEQQRRP